MVKKMSDPVTNAEIEDVLSSIRRLVSEDGRPKLREAVEPVSSPEQKLVLTPALRVREPEPTPEDGEAEMASDVAQERDAPPTYAPDEDQIIFADTNSVANTRAGQSSEIDDETDDRQMAPPDPDHDAEVAAAETDSGDDIHPDLQPDQASRPETAEQTRPNGEELSGGIDEVKSGDAADVEPADEADGSDQRIFRPTSDVSETPEIPEKASVESNPEELENPDGHEDSDARTVPASGTGPDLVWPVRRPYQTSDFAVSDAADGQRAARPSLGAKAAILEAAIGKTTDQWEPDDLGTDDYAGTPVKGMTWDEEASPDDTFEADATSSSESHRQKQDKDDAVIEERVPIAGSAGHEPLDLAAVGETVLDEDSLRELVSEIVRQELQGPLGERITRNVRKLVRREIHRALSIQELE